MNRIRAVTVFSYENEKDCKKNRNGTEVATFRDASSLLSFVNGLSPEKFHRMFDENKKPVYKTDIESRFAHSAPNGQAA